MSTSRHHAVAAPDGPAVAGPYSPAVRLGDLVFVSGQLGIEPATGRLVEGVEAQARQAIANLRGLLEATGLALADVVKTTVFLADIADWPALNSIYAEEFDVPVLPARSAFQVAELPIGARVEIEAIAGRVPA